MRFSLAIFFTCLMSFSTWAGQVTLPSNSRFTIDNHLVYFLTKVPLSQLEPDLNNQVVRISGEISINLLSLPEKTQAEVKAALESALKGERSISGAWLDCSQCVISYVEEAPPEEDIFEESTEILWRQDGQMMTFDPCQTYLLSK